MMRKPLHGRLSAYPVWAAIFTLGLSSSLVTATPPPTVALDELLGRAAWYVDYFGTQFANVVAEEKYLQESSGPAPTARSSTMEPLLRTGSLVQRLLRSDFTLVRSPDTPDLIPF